MKYYTIGEIFRLGLLKTWDGQPYKNKDSVSRVVNKLKYKTVKTRWGVAKALSMAEIDKHNKH